MKTLHRYIVVLLFHFPFYYYLYDTYKSIVRDFQEKYSEETFQYSLELCKCNRTLQKTILLSNDSISFQNTTCGRDAFMRGSHQRVAAFSFYGGGFDPKLTKIFFEGIRGNLIGLEKYYNSSWSMRLYFDLDKKDPFMKDLCSLACNFTTLDLCDVKNLPGNPASDASHVFPMNWRFFPTMDPQVDIMVSRDLDSCINHRETEAVKEWLESDAAVHSMRDHPAHFFDMLGGMWGTKLTDKTVRRLWDGIWDKMFGDNLTYSKRNAKGPDQDILTKYVWPWASHLSMQHDSYLCHRYSNTRSWPTQRPNKTNNFVGAKLFEDYNLITKPWGGPCPEACRKNISWTYC